MAKRVRRFSLVETNRRNTSVRWTRTNSKYLKFQMIGKRVRSERFEYLATEYGSLNNCHDRET